MKPFLDCQILCVSIVDSKNLIKWIQPYNSNTTIINGVFNSGDIIIPEFEIPNVTLLNSIDLNLCEQNQIEVIKNAGGQWEIYIDNYETYINSER